MLIRPARADDAGAIGSLLGDLGYPALAAQVSHRLAAMPTDFVTLVAEVERSAEVVGLAAARTSWRLTDDHPVAQLVTLVTAAAWRGRGAGTALVGAVEEWARRSGADKLLVLSGSHRVAAHRWYARQGFEPTGVRLAKPL